MQQASGRWACVRIAARVASSANINFGFNPTALDPANMDAVDDTESRLGAAPAPQTRPSFLVVALDLHAENWADSKQDLWSVVSSILIFLNAHVALDSGNELAVIGYNSAGARMLYSTQESAAQESAASGSAATEPSRIRGAMIRQFRNLDERVLAAVHDLVRAAAAPKDRAQRTSVAGPLSLALSYLNRLSRELDGHILVVSASPDTSGLKYITAMNSIFTAQRMRIPIDSAVFGPSNTFLQQAADFTGGSYLEIGTEDVLPILLSVFLTEPSVRPHVNLATKPDVDFSAVCFVSKSVVGIGMVCSVCLCIMKEIPADNRCPVCHTAYETRERARTN